MMTGRCLRLRAAVYNYAQHCRQRSWERRRALVPLRAQPTVSLCLPPKLPLCIPRSKAANPGRKLYAAPLRSLTLWLSERVRQRSGRSTHTHPQIPVQTGDATVLSSRLSLSCVPGLCSCCPLCDWCLASLALTNTD